MDTPPDTYTDDDVVTGELVDPADDPFADIARMAAMIGLDVGPMLDGLRPDPNAVTLEQINARIEELAGGLRMLAEGLEPVVLVCIALKANAPKLRKFGIEL
jgi:hypothetical protein